MTKKIIIILLLIAIGSFFAFVDSVHAATCAAGTSQVNIIVRDSNGNLMPDINFAVYNELKNPDGRPYFDDRNILSTGKTDVVGKSGDLCLDSTKRPYAIKLYESSPTYGYFSIWSDQIASQSNAYLLDFKLSDLYVVIRDGEGALTKNSIFDVYVQGFDVDGNPILDKTNLNQDKLIIPNITTGEIGGKHIYLAPGNYVVRVHVLGGRDYFYLWNQQTAAQTTTAIDYHQSTLRVILEDGDGALLKEQNFSLYTQKYDIRNKPIIGDLVIDSKTGSNGKADIFLPKGEYAIKIPSSNSSSSYYIWKILISENKLTNTEYRLSGIRVVLRDENGEIARNAIFNIASQKRDVTGEFVIDNTIIGGLSTGEAGYKDVYLPTGTYAVVYGQKKLFQIDVADNYFTKIDWAKSISAQPNDEVQAVSHFDNKNFVLRKTTLPKIKLKDVKKSISNAYKSSASEIKSYYTITFKYTDEQLRKKGVSANKVRIAFYNPSTKKWQYVGQNYASKHSAKVRTKIKGTFILVAQK